MQEWFVVHYGVTDLIFFVSNILSELSVTTYKCEFCLIKYICYVKAALEIREYKRISINVGYECLANTLLNNVRAGFELVWSRTRVFWYSKNYLSLFFPQSC